MPNFAIIESSLLQFSFMLFMPVLADFGLEEKSLLLKFLDWLKEDYFLVDKGFDMVVLVEGIASEDTTEEIVNRFAKSLERNG